MSINPLLVFTEEIKEFQSHFEGNESDFKLIYQYLLMPIFNLSSPHDLDIPQQQRDRRYYLLKTHSEALGKLLRPLGYQCFFAELLAVHNGNASYQSRHRPQIIGDDTKQAKPSARVMEYLTELFCPVEGKKLPCDNLVVLLATFSDTKWEIPIDLRLWQPQYQSKPKILTRMLKALHAEAKARLLSLEGVLPVTQHIRGHTNCCRQWFPLR